MVQKISKRGVHSGNTLRASNSRFNRTYNRRSCLLRKSWSPTAMKDTILEDLNMNTDNVLYSLNKKGRWELPDMLKDSILTGSYKDLKSNVKLIVSHDIAKKSHTVGYYSSKGNTKKIESKKKTYFDGESVVAQSRIDDKTGTQHILQIEVVYPCPSTCSVVHNPKYVGHHIDKPENGRGRTTKGKRQRAKLSIGKYYNEYCESFEDISDDESETETELDDESSSYLYENANKEDVTNTELLEDIMIHAALMQSLCQRNNRKYISKQIFECKDRLIYIPKITADETPQIEEPTSLALNENRKIMEPVFVLLPKSELECVFLKERYGKSYVECPCLPRKFLIDVSDRMKMRLKNSGCLKAEIFKNWDLTSCVVFSHDEYDVNNTEIHSVFRVCLNIGTNTEKFRILTMFDYYNGCVEDILHRAVTFLEMMSTDGFIENEKQPPKESTSMNFENLNKCQKIKKDVSFVTRKALFKEIFNNSLRDNETVVEHDFGCISTEYCGICLDFIAEGGKPGTALSSCGHWFCDQCWIDHCRSRMNMGSVNITCPEYGCKEIAADAVLLTFINVFEVLGLKRRDHDLKLQASDAKWCPNPNCCRVIKVTNPEKAKDVACKCGTHICFQCLQPPHWPVPCDKAPAYWKKLKLLGDDITLSTSFVTVRGKSCPKCKRFVEKTGGCFIMRCVCGADFCWGCLNTYSNHNTPSEKCNQETYGDKKGTTTLQHTEMDGYSDVSNKNRSADYKKAVNHRKGRHPLKISQLRSGSRQILFKCKKIAKIKGPLYFQIFDGTEDNISICSDVEEKIKEFLNNMVSVYIEIHHMAEYCYVFIDKLIKSGIKSSQLRGNADILGYLADRIFDILTDSGDVKDCRPLLFSLLQIQQKSVYITKHIISFTEKFAA
ncbi:uncharacterized protein LOC127723514 [Mytilus californianus]|uniref:uncharacterized protein LOC127723514 n=1 Tax=Mytilus californianus TaxID=6549 RepID=UPI0022481180|nr:uncharacterized protein LOC127723514 [Mytilus californianus]